MPQNAVPAAALVLMILISLYLVFRPKPAPPAELPQCDSPTELAWLQRTAGGPDFEQLDDGGRGDITDRIAFTGIAETAFDEAAQLRRCTATLEVAATAERRSSSYGVTYEIGWEDRDDGIALASFTDIVRTRLPDCDSETPLAAVRTMLGDLRGARTITFSAITETAYGGTPPKRRCSATALLPTGQERPIAYVIGWGNQAKGTLMIEADLR